MAERFNTYYKHFMRQQIDKLALYMLNEIYHLIKNDADPFDMQIPTESRKWWPVYDEDTNEWYFTHNDSPRVIVSHNKQTKTLDVTYHSKKTDFNISISDDEDVAQNIISLLV